MVNPMMTMVALMAHLMPKEALVEQLEHRIEEFKEANLLHKSEEEINKAFDMLAPYCMMIITKIQGDDPLTMMQEIDKIEKARNLLDPKES
jgi:galactose-1-phosphate uridylyltransferase